MGEERALVAQIIRGSSTTQSCVEKAAIYAARFDTNYDQIVRYEGRYASGQTSPTPRNDIERIYRFETLLVFA